MFDRVLGDDQLFIGGIYNLYNKKALNTANITHIVSVLRLNRDFGHDHQSNTTDDNHVHTASPSIPSSTLPPQSSHLNTPALIYPPRSFNPSPANSSCASTNISRILSSDEATLAPSSSVYSNSSLPQNIPSSESQLFEPYHHLIIPVDDNENENILQYFPTFIHFTQNALDTGGAVFVHCVIGKSRSSTCIIAFLIHKYGMTPAAALAHLRKSRPMCTPNREFFRQLELYYAMGAPSNVIQAPPYQRWLFQRHVVHQARRKLPPTMQFIRFEDVITPPSTDPVSIRIFCRTCRLALVETKFIQPHSLNEILKLRLENAKEDQLRMGVHNLSMSQSMNIRRVCDNLVSAEKSSASLAPTFSRNNTSTSARIDKLIRVNTKQKVVGDPPNADLVEDTARESSTNRVIQNDSPHEIHHDQLIISPTYQTRLPYAHIFVEPLSWMRKSFEAENNAVSGRLTCPKCLAKLGRFSWLGLRCACDYCRMVHDNNHGSIQSEQDHGHDPSSTLDISVLKTSSRSYVQAPASFGYDNTVWKASQRSKRIRSNNQDDGSWDCSETSGRWIVPAFCISQDRIDVIFSSTH